MFIHLKRLDMLNSSSAEDQKRETLSYEFYSVLYFYLYFK